MASRIEDYAVIGDMETAALVGVDGSVDWLCLPRFDSDACFCALLGTPRHGRWLLAPDVPHTVSRRYADDSFVLQTTYTTGDGVVTVEDLMPTGGGRADLVRRVVGVRGSVRLRHEWIVRFGFGRVRPWVHRITDREGIPSLHAVAGPDALVLRGTRLPDAADGCHVDVFDVAAGTTLEWHLTWYPAWQDVPAMHGPAHVADTVTGWQRWLASRGAGASDAVDDGLQALLERSLLVLRLLTHHEAGGIVAAVTTSLPEQWGGSRNWDYRYCWLRDAALTLTALVRAGFRDEARAWRAWLLRAAAGDPEDLQIVYGVDGRRDLPERELEHLPGYEGARPVRVGNAAVCQFQADVLGEVMVALEHSREAGLATDDISWPLQTALVNDLAAHWRRPDSGIWEIRGEPRAFTHSRVMVWAAFDRAVRAVERHGLPGPVDRWRAARDEVRDEVLTEGFDATRGAFVQYYGARHTDASLLQIPLVGFLPPDDPRVVGTVALIERELVTDGGLVYRYRTEDGVDGLPPGEFPFLACTAWYARVLALMGRTDDAHAALQTLVRIGGPLGLLAEEYDPATGRQAGNMPQALSHLGVVQAVLALRAARGRGDPG